MKNVIIIVLLTILTGLVGNKEYREWEKRNKQEHQTRIKRELMYRSAVMTQITDKYRQLAYAYCDKQDYKTYTYCDFWMQDDAPQYIKDLHEKRDEAIRQWYKDHPYVEPHRDTLLEDIKQQLFGS